MASKEFLEEMWAQAKKHLPGWLYASLLQSARPAAGGRAAHREDVPGFLASMALQQLTPELLKDMKDGEISEVWQQLNRWYKSAKKKKSDVDNYVSAGKVVLAEFDVRKKKVARGTPFVQAIEGGCPDEGKVKKSGPDNALVAFVGAAPSKIDKARGEPLTGAPGRTFNELYLNRLGLNREDVLILNASEYEDAQKELEERTPSIVVALGKEANGMVKADVVLPHPAAVLKHGDSGEVGRKLSKIKKQIEVIKQERRKDGGTRSALAADKWATDWHKMLPTSGTGRFAHHCHWQGIKKNEEGHEILGQAPHGDLHFEGDKSLWGVSAFGYLLGKENVAEVYPKTQHSKIWLDVAKSSPLVLPPEGSEGWSKIKEIDSGTYTLGVAKQDEIEIFLDGGVLSGRYLIMSAPLDGRRRWLIHKSSDATPTADRRSLADVISESREKNHDYLIWARPGVRPRLIDVRRGEAVSKMVEVLKADDSKHIVYGVVMDPYGSMGAQPDAHNDWTPPAEIEKTAHDFMKTSRVIGLQHRGRANAYPVESWVEPYPPGEYKKAMRKLPHKVYKRQFGTDVLHSGSWVMGVKLGAKEWDMYLDGELNAFSPGGTGARAPLALDQMPEVSFVELVEKPN